MISLIQSNHVVQAQKEWKIHTSETLLCVFHLPLYSNTTPSYPGYLVAVLQGLFILFNNLSMAHIKLHLVQTIVTSERNAVGE